MNRPDDIPEWAWDKARHTFAELLTPFRYEDKEAFADAEHIARAILAAVEEEREQAAERIKALRSNRQQLRLHLGEMTQQEMRTLMAGLHLAEAATRNRSVTDKG